MTHTLDILEKLIAFDTVSAKTNLSMIDFIEDFLARRGFSITRIPNLENNKAGLFASIGPEGNGILLSAHSDVVPVDGQVWTKNPFKLTKEADRVYGRGATDMKGFLASVLSLADRASRQKLRQPLKLAISYDEEIGCVGIKEMIGHLNAAIGQPHACIVGEPTSMRVAIGHKGKAAFKAKFYGQNGHSAMAPNYINALHIASDFMAQIRELQKEFVAKGPKNHNYDIPYSTLHIGKLAGGTALNMVPSSAEMDFEYRHVPQHDPFLIETQITNIVDQINKSYTSADFGPAMNIDKTNSYPGLNTSPDSEVVSFATSLTKRGAPISVPFGTEAGYFDSIGIPTIVCGPGSMDEQGHKPDECIAISELNECDDMLGKVLQHLSS